MTDETTETWSNAIDWCLGATIIIATAVFTAVPIILIYQEWLP